MFQTSSATRQRSLSFFLRGKMFYKVTIALVIMLLAFGGVWATTYYSQSSGQWNDASLWNTSRDGTGSIHGTDWTGNHSYYIQSGHAITRPGVALGSSSSILVIEDGGSYTNGSSGGTLTFSLVRIESGGILTANATGLTITTFTIYGDGKYIHNTGAAVIPGTTRNFANSTNGGNGNGTVEIQNQGTSAISTGITWGNVVINNSTATQAIGNAGAYASVQGDFEVQNTNGYDYRFTANQTTTHNIAGELIVSGGLLSFKSGSGSCIVNVGKGITIDGGTLTMVSNTAGSIELNVREDIVVDAGSFIATSGTNVLTVINLEGALQVADTANFMAYNGANAGSGYLTFNFSNTQALNRASELKLRTGYTRYYCKWDVNIKSGRTITLGSDVEVGTTNNTGYQNITFTVENGGTLNAGTFIFKNGSGGYSTGYEPRFTLASGSSFSTANAAGITSSGTSGTVQITGTRSYSTAASYTFNGAASQVTGNGLPGTVHNLTIDNSAGVTLSGSITVNGNLTLTSGAFDLDAKSLIVNGTSTLAGGSFASGSTPTTDGYKNASQYISIAANDVNVSGLSASTSIVEGNYPQMIKRQWSISGNSSSTSKSITLTWTVDDDVNFNWNGKVPSVFSGGIEYAGDASGNAYDVSSNPRTITVSAPISPSKADWKIGVKGGSETLPVVLSSFTVSPSIHGHASLQWVTQSETNVLGFYIYRAAEQNLEAAELVSPLIVATNTSTSQQYQYTDAELPCNGTYHYWLQNQDMDGSVGFYGPIRFLYNSDDGANTPPLETLKSGIEKLYPNPFNPELSISYFLASPTNVDINIYNQRGQKVYSRHLGLLQSGRHIHVWNSCGLHGSASSGIYLVELKAGSTSFYSKVTLSK